MKKNMIKITQAPIFLEFLKRFFKYANLELGFDIEKELFITGHCTCKEKDCATVYLKRIKPWKEEKLGVYDYNTNKGYILIHLDDNGFLEIEALCFEKYPYKQEILDLFYKKPKKNTNKKKSLTFENLASLTKYFNGLNNQKTITVIVD